MYNFTHIKLIGKETKADLCKILEAFGYLYSKGRNKKELYLELIKYNEQLVSQERGFKSAYDYIMTSSKDLREMVYSIYTKGNWERDSVCMEHSDKFINYIKTRRTVKELFVWQDAEWIIELTNKEFQKAIDAYVKDDEVKTIENIKQLINNIPTL